jgi:ectoine hydroxylase-related dioxygenase (phytanoyl-CoA dioxygenase family)
MLEIFGRDGMFRFDGLLSAEGVVRARNVVLGQFEKLGLWHDGAWRMPEVLPEWPAMGIKPARDIGHRHQEVDALVTEPAVMALVGELTGGRPLDETLHPGSQVLASLPNAGPWVLPESWHVDTPRLPSGQSPGVQIFTFLETVEPRGGATLAMAGSHRLFDNGKAMKTRDIVRGLRGEPFFARLTAERFELADPSVDLPLGAVGDVPLKVVELTGKPGDAWLVDLRVLHAGAPNARDRPRVMATRRFVRADLVKEIAAAYGWA